MKLPSRIMVLDLKKSTWSKSFKYSNAFTGADDYYPGKEVPHAAA